MKPFIKNAAQTGYSRRARAVAAVIVLAMIPVVPTQASPIRAESVSSDLRAWEKFVDGGETLWESGHAPPINLQVREAMSAALKSTDPTDSPWVQYLAWRRDLDPTRFDFYHPVIGPIVGTLLPPTTTSSTPSPQQITPAPIPEPGTFAISLALLSGGFWWRRRQGR